MTLPVRNVPNYVAMLEVAGTRLSTDPQVYNGFAWTVPLGRHPVPRSAFANQYGIQGQESFDIVISDPNAVVEALVETWYGQTATLTLLTEKRLLDGTDVSEINVRTMIVTSYTASGVLLTIRLSDAQVKAWDTLFPSTLYTADDFPGLYPDAQDTVVQEVVGFGRKIRCARVENEPTVMAICKQGTFGTGVVTTVYRDGAVAATDVGGSLQDTNGNVVATVSTRTGAMTSIVVVVLEFVLFQPGNAVIEADYDCRVTGGETLDAATELNRVMVSAGLTINAASLTAAQNVASANRMFLDTVYRRQRTINAISEDYLFYLRGNLTKGSADEYEIIQDILRASGGTYREAAGDQIEVGRRGRTERPSKVILKYGVNPENTNEFFHTLERTIVGGNGGAEVPYEAPYTLDKESADRLIAYLALRAQYNRYCGVTIYGKQLVLGDRITLYPSIGASGEWTIRGIERDVNSNVLSLQEYNDLVYDYVPGPAPTDPTSPYQPDYSNTPPAAPTELTVVASGADPDHTGKVIAWIDVTARPPATNWSFIRFYAADQGNNTVQRIDGTAQGGGIYGARIGNLRPNQLQNIWAQAVNENNIEGIPTSVIPTTSATDSTVPGTVTWYTPEQGTGRTIELFWIALPDDDISGYRIEREITGSGSWVTLAETDLVTHHTDAYQINYGISYTYRIQARDTSGNTGPFSSSPPIVPVQNIGNSDGNTGDPFDINVMTTDIIYAKEFYTAQPPISPRVEINPAASNEVRSIDNGNVIVGKFGYVSAGGDVSVLDLGHPSYLHFCLVAQNANATWPTGQFTNWGAGSGMRAFSNGSQPTLVGQNNSIGLGGQFTGGISIDGSLMTKSGGVLQLTSATLEVLNGDVTSRFDVKAFDDLWIGYTGSGIDAIRISRDLNIQFWDEIRFYRANSSTQYFWVNFVSKTSGFSY